MTNLTYMPGCSEYLVCIISIYLRYYKTVVLLFLLYIMKKLMVGKVKERARLQKNTELGCKSN